MAQNKPTLADVAQQAGVSMMTVSRAINNKGDINPKTRERILHIAKTIGYRPNYLARGLATNRSTTIGLVVPDISNPFFSEITRGVEDEAHKHGYNVFLCNFDENPEREQAALISLAEKQVDGIILCSSRQENEQLLQSLTLFQQVVLINRNLPEAAPHTQSLILDDFSGAKQAVNHFLSHGRQRISFLSGPLHSRSAAQKQQGYLAALEQQGLSIDPNLIKSCLPTMASGKETMSALLHADPSVDAVLAFNDLIAIGALLACQEFGKTIPQEIEIIGFDDIPLSKLMTPSLTTLAYPKKEIGVQSIRMIFQMTDNHTAADFPKMFAPHFVFRQSSPV